MATETFAKVLPFVQRYPYEILMVSGGEPLEHPDFFEMMELAKTLPFPQILILSNGMFLENEKLLQKVIDLGLPCQITNDPRYYPQRIKKIDHPLFMYEDHLRVFTKMGRGKDLDQESTRLAPMCFNLRSAGRSLRDFNTALFHLRQSAKFCTPSVNVDGSVVAGETPICYKIGDVESSDEELLEGLLQVSCNNCDLEDNLSPQYRDAIGLPPKIWVPEVEAVEVDDVWAS
jgi:hypothetical protein